jgi:hypothetical protein
MSAERFKVERLYADESGESHRDDVEFEFTRQDFAPLAKPLGVTKFSDAGSAGFIQGEVGRVGNWHPVPQRQFMFRVHGTVEAEASDGEKRQFGPGEGALLEDIAGKGHFTRVLGDTSLIMIVTTPRD